MKKLLFLSLIGLLSLNGARASDTTLVTTKNPRRFLAGKIVAQDRTKIVLDVDGLVEIMRTNIVTIEGAAPVVFSEMIKVPGKTNEATGYIIISGTADYWASQARVKAQMAATPAASQRTQARAAARNPTPGQPEPSLTAINTPAGQSIVDQVSAKVVTGRSPEAEEYYQQTANGLMNGSVNLDNIYQQAKATLAQLERYAPEMGADPNSAEWNQHKAILEDFVRRYEAGER